MSTTPAEDLDAALAARTRILETGQAVAYGDRSYTAADLKELNAMIANLQAQVNATTRASYRLAATDKGV